MIHYINKVKNSRIFWILIVLIFLIWLNNSSIFTGRKNKKPVLLAHCALGQSYDLEGVKWDTNTAARIHKPEHFYIENTIPSIQAAFDYGADIVEFDIRLTKDNKLAVFHDDILEYRTNGIGKLMDHTMAELRTLDVGFGYTADEGQSFPLRGKGVGLMVAIEEVFDVFPDKQFLIHIKDDGEKIGKVLSAFIHRLEFWQIKNISVYGNDAAIDLINEYFPSIKTLTASKMKNAALQYLLVGWLGILPDSIKNRELHLPLEFAWLFWGWPDKFLSRMESVNTRVVITKRTNGWTDGLDRVEDLKKLPPGFSGTIWTNRIDKIGPLIKKSQHP